MRDRKERKRTSNSTTQVQIWFV